MDRIKNDRTIEINKGPGARQVPGSWVRRVVAKVLECEKSSRRRVSVLLVDDRKIRRLNKEFLKRDRVTDVIAFWCRENSLVGAETGYLGDLVVSVERARVISSRLGIPFKEELARYLIHGTLHLVGYKDERPAERTRMLKKQEVILKRI